MTIIRNFKEFAKSVRDEFLNLGFTEKITYDGRIREYRRNDDVVFISIHNDCVQIFLSFVHDWSSGLFPCRCIMTVLGNSLFYYGEVDFSDVQQKMDWAL